MPYPLEYERAGQVFTDFLVDVKLNASFQSSHMAYTMAQGVFQVFRRRLRIADSIRFSNALPAGIRALFVADWDTAEPTKAFATREQMNLEVRELRRDHNFSDLADDPILCVAKALRKYVEPRKFDEALRTLPEDARLFWTTQDTA